MKNIFFLLLCIVQPAFSKCLDIQSEKIMASEIYRDEDFRRFACKGKECTEDIFLKALEFYPEALDRTGSHEGCLVGTSLNVQDQKWWFFLTDGNPSFQFSHLGRIDFSKNYSNGRKIIILIDLLDRTQYSQQNLVWTGEKYFIQGKQTLHTWP